METEPGAAFAVKRSRIPLVLMPGCACMRRAASPAMCGDAIEVPDIVAVEVLPEMPAEVIVLPGAYKSTQLPVFE